jgi:hypothetical protein
MGSGNCIDLRRDRIGICKTEFTFTWVDAVAGDAVADGGFNNLFVLLGFSFGVVPIIAPIMLPLRFIGVDGRSTTDSIGICGVMGIVESIVSTVGTSCSPKKFKCNFVLYLVRDRFRGAEDIEN